MPTPWALHNVMYLELGSQRFQWGKYSNRLLFGVGQEGDFLVAHCAYGHLGALGALEVLYIAAQSLANQIRAGAVLDLGYKVNLLE